MVIKTISVDSVMLYMGDGISPEILDKVQTTYIVLKHIRGVIDITPSYNSILIRYDINIYDHKSIKKSILKSLNSISTHKTDKIEKRITVPTRYDETVALDLRRIAEINSLTIREVIRLHTEQTYRVYAIGFMVGFAYLATLDKKIITPRLETPRAKVPKGSVAIADNQTAIYPKDSAGGWNIIGYTEFDRFEEFSVGDIVEFVSI